MDVEIRDAHPHELAIAAAVLSRGMRDNPLHRAVFDPRPDVRERKLRDFFLILLAWMPHAPWVGVHDGSIVAVCGMGEPGKCQPTFVQKSSLVPRLVKACGAGATVRALIWFAQWGWRDPKEAHWHLGPIGVDAHLQGRGIGSRVVDKWCQLLDAQRAAGYLETDKEDNIGFYEQFGFEVLSEAKILGTPNWFMFRAAR